AIILAEDRLPHPLGILERLEKVIRAAGGKLCGGVAAGRYGDGAHAKVLAAGDIAGCVADDDHRLAAEAVAETLLRAPDRHGRELWPVGVIRSESPHHESLEPQPRRVQ